MNLTYSDIMNELTLELSSIISQRKDNYYIQLVKKLNDPQRNAKTYWSILKTFFNGRKIPIIPPLLIDGKIVSDFKEKTSKFNEFSVANVHLLTIAVSVQGILISSLTRESPQLFLMIMIL